LENEIVQVQNRARESLGEAPAIGKCTCGADLYENIKFCGACGKKVEQIPTSETPEHVPPSKNVCSQCKAVLPSNTKFCNECGAKAL